MAERSVPDVVQQERCADQSSLICDVGFVNEKFTPVPDQCVESSRSHRERAEGVAEARVLGRGKREICKTQLPQAAQALHDRGIQQPRFRRGKLNEAVDRIVNPFHYGFCSGYGEEDPCHMRFDQGAIREIHARVDIASFIGSYVSLHKRGNDLVGLCPFHSERTPSFHVHPDKGFFKCFGCGAGGDIIAFISKLENLTFPDAVRMLAQRAGVELEPENPQVTRTRSEREAIYEANHIAAAFFERMLRGDRGAQARAYCERRGLSQAVIEKFHIGYAPDDWSALTDELQRSGVDPEISAKAGLIKRGERSFRDFYRARLMVPTYSTTGEVIAFGGRALGDAEPKYLNTSTTPVYTKGRHVFALNIARRAASADRTLIVVEGYLDCIALHQAGFENAVASLGTAFTEEQAKELQKYADGIFLCFDGDTAGNAAAAKAIEVAVQVIEHAGSGVRIVALPAGCGP